MATDFRTINEMLLHRVSSTGGREAYTYPDGGGWKRVTWAEFGGQVKNTAMGLRALGVKNGERVGLICGTRYHWIVADMGINCAGAATTTVYPNSTAEDTAYILGDSSCVVAIAENEEQVAKLIARKGELGGVKKVVSIDGQGGHDGWVISWAELQALGEKASQADFETVAKSVTQDSVATLIYTSGTTGKPKGVVLTHDCWCYEAWALDELKLLVQDDVQFLWLPLAHSFGKLLEVCQLRIGFSTAVDGRVDKIVENLGQVRPTFVAAVPRIFEKVYNKVVQGAQQGGGLKYSIFKWAFSVGKEVSQLRQRRQEPSGLLALKNGIATKLVFSKLQERFGGRMRYFISGSAPLSREIAEFFHAAGILILEGYGLTETSAFTFVNRPESFEFGTVGRPAPTTEFKIAQDGEILIKGRGVMREYHNRPDATAETIKDGWLYSGDIGEVTPGGNLKITDRKKDLIKTSGGKYVAPQNLEGRLKVACPFISQVLVHGNNRNFCSALVAMDPEAITAWAKTNGVAGTYAEIVKDPRVHAMIKPYFDELNKTLASYESIKKFAILPADLTLEAGDLTPSQKLKRKAVEAKYKDLLDSFYAGSVAEG